MPYFSPSLGDKEAQLLYHTRQGTLRKVSFAASKPNKNTLVLGGSGSGKSFNVANVFEQDGQPVIWEAQASQDWVAYPAKEAPLARGAPFKVEAVAGGSVVASALFSINPALDVADSTANRVVPLTAP